MLRQGLSAVVMLTILSSFAQSKILSHSYDENDEVLLWMNSVGPRDRRDHQSYTSRLPLCRGPKKLRRKAPSPEVSDAFRALQGVELDFSGLDIEFKVFTAKTTYCEIVLDVDKFIAFEHAVKNRFWYQMYIDDLPIWGEVGETRSGSHSQTEYFVWTHKKFDLGYNGHRIVDANLTSMDGVKLEIGTRLSFKYEVNWGPSNVSFEDRLDKYLTSDLVQRRIHWFTIFGSFLIAVTLVAFVITMLMKKVKPLKAEDILQEKSVASGWKQIVEDVARPPRRPLCFSTFVGSGAQLILATFIVAIWAILSELYWNYRFNSLIICSFVYVVLSPINGYIGGALYARLGGKKWVHQAFVSAVFVPSFAGATILSMNPVYVQEFESALPSRTLVTVICMSFIVILPLTWVGNRLGRSRTSFFVRPQGPPRPVPPKKWYTDHTTMALLSGLFPFAAVFSEMYFIFTSHWEYEMVHIYGFALIGFIIVLIVTVCSSIVSTYYLLNAEDYRWPWISFFSGASVSLYVLSYAAYYFFLCKSSTYDLNQNFYYFSYMVMFSFILGLMCGTGGYWGSSAFVKKIYPTVTLY